MLSWSATPWRVSGLDARITRSAYGQLSEAILRILRNLGVALRPVRDIGDDVPDPGVNWLTRPP